MGRPRINPPSGAAETIKNLAAQGYSILGIAEELGVHIETLEAWMNENDKFLYAYQIGCDSERQILHRIVFDAAKANRSVNGNAKFLLLGGQSKAAT